MHHEVSFFFFTYINLRNPTDYFIAGKYSVRILDLVPNYSSNYSKIIMADVALPETTKPVSRRKEEKSIFCCSCETFYNFGTTEQN